MREILFRGKRTDNGEWVKGHYAVIENPLSKDGKPEKHLICNGTNAFNYEVSPDTIGQYTGLTDKNGKKIFEGDILEFSDRLVSVFWHTHLGCWDSNFLKFTEKNNGRDDMSPCRWEYRAEVIGNIHDNPELLKGAKDDA